MDSLVNRLTSALATGDFDTHEALLPQYRASVAASLAEAKAPSFREELLAAAVRQSDEWLNLARVMRAHIQDELVLVTGESHYHNDRVEHHTVHAVG